MSDRTIYTLDARENIFLEVTKEYHSLDDKVMHNEINDMFSQLIEILVSKNIKYSDLKSCLIPKNDKKEIGLVFDTTQIESSSYADAVFSKLLPMLQEESKHSILCGDYIGDNSIQNELFFRFYSEIIQVNKFDYKHSSQFYIIYINNLSNNAFDNLRSKLKEYQPFSGFFDLTNQSFIKSYLSTILVNNCIKIENKILLGHEDDRDNSENINLVGYPYEESGYNIFSLQGIYFGVFLSYKIEREVYKGFESDIDFSLNSISPIISKIKTIEIEDEKFDYLLEYKSGKMKKASLISSSKEELIELIKKKINSNYIYNMTNLKSYNTFKFDILIELLNEMNEIVKVTIGFEYLPKHAKLRLITLY